MKQHDLVRRMALIGLLLLLAALYVTGALRQLERVNTKMVVFDQGAYMDFTLPGARSQDSPTPVTATGCRSIPPSRRSSTGPAQAMRRSSARARPST